MGRVILGVVQLEVEHGEGMSHVALRLDRGDLRALTSGDELPFTVTTREGDTLRCALKLKGGRGRSVGELDHRLHVDGMVVDHLAQGATVTPLFTDDDVPFLLKLSHPRDHAHADDLAGRRAMREPLELKHRLPIAAMFGLFGVAFFFLLDRPMVALCFGGVAIWMLFTKDV